MKLNKKTKSGIYWGILCVFILFSCQPSRETEHNEVEKQERHTEVPQTPEEYSASPEAVEALDNRIIAFSRELEKVEDWILEEENILSPEAQQAWEHISIKREILNQHIDEYNQAIRKESVEEALRIREKINILLGDLEKVLFVVKEDIES